jgi:hypothetical protein
VPDLTNAATEEFRRLDQIVPTGGATTLRFLGDEEEQALLTPVSALVASSKSSAGRVKITGRTAEDGKAQVLFLSSPQAIPDVNSLLELIAGKAPGTARPSWIAIPVSSDRGKKAGPREIEILGNGVRQAGTFVVRDKNKKVASFGLYPLKQESAPRLQPVKRKLPEPKGNLRAREAWFQRRTGGR